MFVARLRELSAQGQGAGRHNTCILAWFLILCCGSLDDNGAGVLVFIRQNAGAIGSIRIILRVAASSRQTPQKQKRGRRLLVVAGRIFSNWFYCLSKCYCEVMTCRRCNSEKPEAAMASKHHGRLRNWCKACDALRVRERYMLKRVVMRGRIGDVSDRLGLVLAEVGL